MESNRKRGQGSSWTLVPVEEEECDSSRYIRTNLTMSLTFVTSQKSNVLSCSRRCQIRPFKSCISETLLDAN
jgi:hypothetical protein